MLGKVVNMQIKPTGSPVPGVIPEPIRAHRISAGTRNRHLARLCRSCTAPMAGHDDTCWRCGVEWATEGAPPTTLRLVPGGVPAPIEDPERRANEGGRLAAEVTAPPPVTATGS
jgi:hypothetical protein